MKSVMKTEFRNLALTTRYKLGLTQREMSELLSMSEHAYSEIEVGKTSCGTLTSILLIQLQDNPQEFLTKLNNDFRLIEESEEMLT